MPRGLLFISRSIQRRSFAPRRSRVRTRSDDLERHGRPEARPDRTLRRCEGCPDCDPNRNRHPHSHGRPLRRAQPRGVQHVRRWLSDRPVENAKGHGRSRFPPRPCCRRLSLRIDRYCHAESRAGLPLGSGLPHRRFWTHPWRRHWLAHSPLWLVLRQCRSFYCCHRRWLRRACRCKRKCGSLLGSARGRRELWNLDLRLAPHTEKVPSKLRGRPVAGSSLVWTGAPEGAKRYFEHAFSMCHPDSVRSQTVSFLHLQTMADSDFPHGRRYYTKSGYFQSINDGTIDRFLEALTTIPSPETQIELTYLGGTAEQVAANETAFGDRSAPFITNLLANWQDAAADALHISWIRSLFQKLRPAMTPGVYVNFMSGDEQDRVPEAYRQRWERMIAVKTHYDPDNFFRLNQNVRPHGRP